MSIEMLAVPVSFIILATLALWLIIGAKGYWWVKLFLISCSIYFSVAVWTSLGALTGWPSDAILPKKFQVYWTQVKEPDKSTGEDGAIYFWVKELENKDSLEKDQKRNSFIVNAFPAKDGESRLHVIPYSKKMHQASQGIQKMLKEGIPVMGKNNGAFEGEENGGEGEGTGEGEGKQMGQGDRNDGGERGYNGLGPFQEFEFYELPPPKLPQKNTQFH